MNNWMKMAVLAAPLAFGGAFAPTGAQAALVACGATGTVNLTPRVQTATNCQYLTPPDPSNVASLTNINAAGFFGFSDWVANSVGNTQLEPAGGQSGTWAIANWNPGAFDYMIVFKSGQGTNLIGFLFGESAGSGTWQTPFLSPPFTLSGQTLIRDVSHYTIVQRGGGTPDPVPVPVPAALALFGVALAGLGLALRRRGA